MLSRLVACRFREEEGQEGRRRLVQDLLDPPDPAVLAADPAPRKEPLPLESVLPCLLLNQ